MNTSPPETPEALNAYSEQPAQTTPLTFKKDELVSTAFIFQLIIALAVLLVSLKLFARYVVSKPSQTQFGMAKEMELTVRASVKLSVKTRLHHVSLGEADFLVMESSNQTTVHAVNMNRHTLNHDSASPSSEGELS